jgi:hypothetical protein
MCVLKLEVFPVLVFWVRPMYVMCRLLGELYMGVTLKLCFKFIGKFADFGIF